MKELPIVDRPREKLTRAGAWALGDNEVLALVLGSGTRRRGALTVAQDVLAVAGGADGLPRLSLDELQRIDGVGEARAARVLAAVELGRRALIRAAGERPQFLAPADIAHYLAPLYAGYRVERFGVMLLDARLRLLRTAIVGVGTQDGVLVLPRDIFREAVLGSAASVVVFHNHPSGDPTPSQDDVAVTGRIVRAGETMGIAVVDHIILGSGRFFSFKLAHQLR
ncbi:MAG: DNA repair protein RadC [Acidobacteria bacterium]|nr:DNA repair protein RadC [Acidobacteriota bacterium]